MSGRIVNGILVNDSSSQQAKLFVETYRQQYNYPSWFENTLGYAESGQITVLALQQAAGNLLDQGLMTQKPMYKSKMDSSRVREIIEDYHGDDITRLDTLHAEQEGRLSDAHKHRLSIEEKVNNAKAEHQKIWDSISTLHTKHTNQEDRISQKSGIGHTHAGGKEKADCGWFGEKCCLKQIGILDGSNG